jgi:general secretion pathway protein D
LPGALLQALLQDSTTRLLQRPQLRATDGGKASLKIGSKIPYVSGSLNSAIATPGSIPYATTQFQQVDVGTNLDFQPRVNGPDDISMHVKVEISQVSGNQNIGGIEQPIISQRINEAEIRLRNGEVSMIGGVSNNSDSVSASGIPGLTNMPVLGYLFGSKTKGKTDDQIVIALIPHILRAPDLSTMAEDPIETGSETNFRVLHSVPSSASITITPGQNNPAPAAQPGAPAPVTPGPLPQSAPPVPQSAPPPQPRPPAGPNQRIPQVGTPPNP